MDYTKICTAVFTPVEYGCCGLSEEDAIASAGRENVEVYHQNFTPLEWSLSHDRPLAKECYAKLIVDTTQQKRVLGFHYLGPNAGEVTQAIGIAIKLNATYDDFINTVGIHPTTAEIFTTLEITKESGNGTQASVASLIEMLNGVTVDTESVEVVIAPPAIFLATAKANLKPEIQVSAQNVNLTGLGAYTGEIAAEHLVERRALYGETDFVVAEKTKRALDHGLNVILCVGESLDERKSDQTLNVITRQLKAVADLLVNDLSLWSRVVVAYEPVWAIGTGVVATPEQAQDAHKNLRAYVTSHINPEVASELRIIYGGSVNAKNSAELIALHDTTVQTLTMVPSMENGRIRWEDSPLVRAVKFGRTLVVDEADKAPLEVVCVLKGLIEDGEMLLGDGRRIVDRAKGTFNDDHDDDGSVICIHPRFRLWVLANRPGYPFLGNNFFSEVGDIFSTHVLDNPDPASELALLQSYAPNVSTDVLMKLCAAFSELRSMVENGTMTYPYSTREAVAIAKHLEAFPEDGVAYTLENVLAFDGYDAALRQRLRDVFG
ncbi:hypothetical protein DYB25_011190, partial [Aphanomyces astaci]